MQESEQLFAEAVVVCREQRDWNGLAQPLIELGRIERNRHNTGQAIELYQEAAGILRSLPNPLKVAHTIRHVGDILRQEGSLGALAEARACYEEALFTYRAHAETPNLDLANAIRGYALLKEQSGEKEGALESSGTRPNSYTKLLMSRLV